MQTERRDFLKNAGAVSAMAATAAIGCAPAGDQVEDDEGEPVRTLGTGLATGLTLLTRRADGRDRLAVKTDKGILDVPQAARLLGMYAPATLDDMLQQEDGPSVMAVVKAALESPAAADAFVDESGIEYGPLVSRPEKIVCVGLNYRKHAEETGAAIPKYPVLFNKYNGALNRHNGTVKLPVDLATQFDYEAELVIIMGREAKAVAEADALSYVAGYATGNDFSARDLQSGRGGQWMIGKAIDGFAPLGPHLVTADQVDPDNLAIECTVNGETRQSSNTADLIFDTRAMVSYISHYFTLKPGDVIFTGTPEGVILGMPKDRQVWLEPGDRVTCRLEKLGELAFELA